jgi:Protein of unknown function (DUF3987)
MTVETIQALVAQTPVQLPNTEPRPLTPELSPSLAFPVEAMPKLLADAILATHTITQAPIALIAQSFLAVASLVAQSHVNIIALDGTVKPCSLFIVSIADSGERKSSADGFAMRPIKNYEQSLYIKYNDEWRAYENKRDAYEATRKSILNKSSKGKNGGDKERTQEEIQQELETLGNPPKPPFDCAITCEEPTFPALVKSLYGGYPSMGLFSNEGGEMLGGHAMNNDNKLRTITGLSKLWDGGELKHKRVEWGEIRLLGKRLALHLMMQPHLAMRFMADTDIANQGFGARCLIAYPPSTMGTRFRTKATKPKAERTIAHYSSQIEAILNRPLPLGDNPFSQELEPFTVPYDVEAQDLIDDFFNTLESQLTPDGALRHIAGFINKLPEQAIRIAVSLAFVEANTQNESEVAGLNSKSTEVIKPLNAQQMQRGITLAEYYLTERLRLSDPNAVNTDLSNAEELRRWLKNVWKEPFISSAEVGQYGPKHLRKAEVAHPALELIATHGWLFKIDEPQLIKGNIRQHCYAMHESLTSLGG